MDSLIQSQALSYLWNNFALAPFLLVSFSIEQIHKQACNGVPPGFSRQQLIFLFVGCFFIVVVFVIPETAPLLLHPHSLTMFLIKIVDIPKKLPNYRHSFIQNKKGGGGRVSNIHLITVSCWHSDIFIKLFAGMFLVLRVEDCASLLLCCCLLLFFLRAPLLR
jgi:hypothetical protein